MKSDTHIYHIFYAWITQSSTKAKLVLCTFLEKIVKAAHNNQGKILRQRSIPFIRSNGNMILYYFSKGYGIDNLDPIQ